MNTNINTGVIGIWRSIDSAPKDGTVVVTNDGTSCYVDQRHWGSPVTNGWYLCPFDCQPDTSYDGAFRLQPTTWLDFEEPK